MAGTSASWSAERRAAAAERVRKRWQDPDYRAQQSASRSAAMTPARRAEKSRSMIELNRRMKTDMGLKGANLAGIGRSYVSGKRQAKLAATMRETMARPEMREAAAEHCRKLKGSGHTVRGWKTRRRNARKSIPAGFEDLYRGLVRKVGSVEALRLVEIEARRARSRRLQKI